MENVNTLDHLLQVESNAAILINDAQKEADRRLLENEEKSRRKYEERLKAEVQLLEESFNKEKIIIKEKYKKALDEYCEEISQVNINTERFSASLNEYLDLQKGKE